MLLETAIIQKPDIWASLLKSLVALIDNDATKSNDDGDLLLGDEEGRFDNYY